LIEALVSVKFIIRCKSKSVGSHLYDISTFIWVQSRF